MIILLSPSKTLNFEDELISPASTAPRLLKHTEMLLSTLKKKPAHEIQKLMGISDRLAQLNFERFQSFPATGKGKGSRSALLAFRGDVYQGFELQDYSKKDFEFAQAHLVILSGLYGYLRPLDAIFPYRLEMGTKLKTPKGKDLYSFWGDTLTRQLESDLTSKKHKEVLNLASQEYSKSINFKNLSVPAIDVDFKILKNGSLRTIALFAKKARGLMANYIVRNRIKSSKELIDFQEEGYRYNSKLSSSQKFVFVKKG
ncbi:MAG: peroxide stress protein YaaA [Bdellovibrionales bacterium]|nr:peroxide stress protein YaaA [Bdellovibrionales bacterium]